MPHRPEDTEGTHRSDADVPRRFEWPDPAIEPSPDREPAQQPPLPAERSRPPGPRPPKRAGPR